MASLEGTFNTASDLISSTSRIAERSKKVEFIRKTALTISTFKQAVFHPLQTWDNVKSAVSTPVAKKMVRGVKAMGLLNCCNRQISRKCAEKFYEYSGAGGVLSSLGDKGLSAVVNSSFIQENLGKTGASILGSVGSWLGFSAQEVLLDKLSEQVFQPIITILQEKAAEQRIKGGIDIAIDTSALWATGGLAIAGNLQTLQKVAVTADKLAMAAKVGAFGYVYGNPLYTGGKLAVQCCSLKMQMNRIEKAMSAIDLTPYLQGSNLSESVVKQTLAVLLMVSMESSSMMGLDLAAVFGDAETVAILINSVALVKKLC